MRSNLDETIDPCVDFYQYSCGGWIKNNTIPGDETSLYQSFDVSSRRFEERMKQIIDAGVSEDDPQSVKFAFDWYHACSDNGKIIFILDSWIRRLIEIINLFSIKISFK
jgi:predicted metalloendopeptidase